MRYPPGCMQRALESMRGTWKHVLTLNKSSLATRFRVCMQGPLEKLREGAHDQHSIKKWPTLNSLNQICGIQVAKIGQGWYFRRDQARQSIFSEYPVAKKMKMWERGAKGQRLLKIKCWKAPTNTKQKKWGLTVLPAWPACLFVLELYPLAHCHWATCK